MKNWNFNFLQNFQKKVKNPWLWYNFIESYNHEFYSNLSASTLKISGFSKVFEFLKFYKILSFLVKIWSYGQKRIFLWSWQLHLTPNLWERNKLQKKLFFQKLWKKPKLLMVLTLKLDKNSQRYITFNLQRLSRTVLVYHFNFEKIFKIKKQFFSKKVSWKKNFWVSKNFSKLFPHNILHFFWKFVVPKKVSAKLFVFKNGQFGFPWNKDYLTDSPPR